MSDTTAVDANDRESISDASPVGEPTTGAVATAERPVDQASIDLLLDVPLQLSVELGRTRLTVSEILALRMGSVLELNKMANEPGDVLVNGALIARGEVVVVDEKFGVRIVEVLPAATRLASLG
jgi:flagellar motor switch protein FliN/FliY